MDLSYLVEAAGEAIEAFGVVLIVGALFVATLRLATRPSSACSRYERFRRDLGAGILLGLEVLVAADIVRTVASSPTLAGVSVLALIVAIRTFLSWSLALELEGRWPWQRAEGSAASAHPSEPAAGPAVRSVLAKP